jgi:hypothetical protein
MKRTLNTLLPTTFPSASSGRPVRVERTVTTISGADVPRATTVSPTTTAGIPRIRARWAEPRTRSSAPARRTRRPRKKRRRGLSAVLLSWALRW